MPPNYRIEHRVGDQVPSSGVSVRGAHAGRLGSKSSAYWNRADAAAQLGACAPEE